MWGRNSEDLIAVYIHGTSELNVWEQPTIVVDGVMVPYDNIHDHWASDGPVSGIAYVLVFS
jgi:hypothetical protein